MNIENLSEDMILKTPLNQPEKIFTGSDVELKKIYKKLSLLWHPDKQVNGKNTNAIFTHIHDLYQSALTKSKKGTLGTNLNALDITSVDGKSFIFRYQKAKNFELGEYYIAKEFVVWAFKNDFINEVKDSLKNLSGIAYQNDKMKSAFEKMLPVIYKQIETADRFIVVIKKPKEFLNLSDVASHYKKMPAKHVAWILSRLYNLACFLNYNQIMHGGINLDNCFINPETHELLLAGGWWYSKKDGEKLSMLSREAYDIAPVSMLNSKKAEMLLDLHLIKKLGRTLLGDAIGDSLLFDKEIPVKMTEWLRNGHQENAVKQYTQWYDRILTESFGERKFVEMKVKSEDLYQ